MTRYFRDYPARTGDRTLFKMEHYLEAVSYTHLTLPTIYSV